MPSPEPTLADLIEATSASDLSKVQIRDRTSALRTIARALDAQPDKIALNVKLLRKRLDEVSPEAVGISRARWRNARSLLSRCLETRVKVMPAMQRTAASPAWQGLLDKLARSRRVRLGALIRYLCDRGIEPSAVSVADLEAYGEAIIENRLRADQEKTWDGVRWAWNKCTEEVEDWPDISVAREDRRVVYVRPWSDFPPSLKADVDAYLKVLSGEVIDEDGPLRALKPITLKQRDYQIRSAASALASSGRAPETILSLSDLAQLEPMKLILSHIHNRGGTEHQAAAFNMCQVLKAIARYWLKLDAETLAKVGRISAKLSPRQAGLTNKNRKRLMPLNDPTEVRRFLGLPFSIATALKAKQRHTRVDAISAQLAVAIAILQSVPLRIKNLVALDLDKHLIARGKRVFISIAGEEVKNARPYEMELPSEVADLIAWYCLNHRPLLLDQAIGDASASTALFPGNDGQPKQASGFSRQISERVKQHLGWPVHPHLFRHIAAKIYLEQRPGEYGVVSLLLNHQSVTTTMRAYTGTESISASRHFQSVVAGLRNPTPSARARR